MTGRSPRVRSGVSSLLLVFGLTGPEGAGCIREEWEVRTRQGARDAGCGMGHHLNICTLLKGPSGIFTMRDG